MKRASYTYMYLSRKHYNYDDQQQFTFIMESGRHSLMILPGC